MEANDKKQKPLDRRVVKTRKAIREAFKQIVSEKGLKGVSISSIAREADIDRKTFYLHYESVDDLIESIIKEKLLDISEVLKKMPAKTGLRETLEIFFANLNEILENNIVICRYIAGNMSIDSVISYLREPLSEWVIGLNPILKEIDEETLDYLVSFHTAGVLAMYNSWLKAGKQPIEEVSALAIEVLFNSFEGLGFHHMKKRLNII